MTAALTDSVKLPCGIELPNRLVKVAMTILSVFAFLIASTAQSAMAESLAHYSTGLPNEMHENLYRTWADAGYGLLITGDQLPVL